MTQELIPKLPLHRVMVMNNATFHKRKDAQPAILNAGHTLEYLPPHSPDLNPIMGPQAKAIRRRINCSIDELFRDQNYVNQKIVV
ncbi:MAG: transposase [Alphaproteobacteria bacterium]|nr:transposase [Alphaproteobacteria bacterium]